MIDFDNSTIKLPPKNTKSKRGRTVSMSTMVHTLLLKRKLQVQGSKFVFPSKSKKGHLLHPKKSWHSALKKAGISNFRLHDLRHTFASRLAQTQPIQVVKLALGHSDYKTSERYMHIDSRVSEAVEQLTSYSPKAHIDGSNN